MFCSKCGSQISILDRFCPKCGQENINFQEDCCSNAKSVQMRPARFLKRYATEHQRKRLILFIIAGICILIIIVAGAVSFWLKENGLGSASDGNETYIPHGLMGYIDTNGVVYFITGEEVISFPGEAAKGRSTPDHTRFLVLQENGELNLYNDKSGAGTMVSGAVENISAISNEGLFYTTGNERHLHYYDFETRKITDTEMESKYYVFSIDHGSVAGISEDGEMRLYNKEDDSSKILCNVEEDTDICSVADDGTNVIWTVQDGSTYGIYMLSDGVPERIGKITNPEKYSYVSGYFYNGGKSFYTYSPGSTQMLICKDGQIKEIALPGVNEAGVLQMDSDDDTQAEFYTIVNKIKSSDTGSLYKLSPDGTLSMIVDGVSMNNTWYDSVLSAGKNRVLCINGDKDLYIKGIGKNDEETLITTDVKEMLVPAQGGYAYIVKSGSLYYIDLSDKEYTLHLIANTITENDKVYVTDEPDTIYFISNSQKIEDAYRYKGTLFRYSIGGEVIELADDIISVLENDEYCISAEHPLFEKYVSYAEYEYIVDIGTYSDGGYKTLVHSVKK